jgi:hypothetical protein
VRRAGVHEALRAPSRLAQIIVVYGNLHGQLDLGRVVASLGAVLAQDASCCNLACE